jgi:hypothetical protein
VYILNKQGIPIGKLFWQKNYAAIFLSDRLLLVMTVNLKSFKPRYPNRSMFLPDYISTAIVDR